MRALAYDENTYDARGRLQPHPCALGLAMDEGRSHMTRASRFQRARDEAESSEELAQILPRVIAELSEGLTFDRRNRLARDIATALSGGNEGSADSRRRRQGRDSQISVEEHEERHAYDAAPRGSSFDRRFPNAARIRVMS